MLRPAPKAWVSVNACHLQNLFLFLYRGLFLHLVQSLFLRLLTCSLAPSVPGASNCTHVSVNTISLAASINLVLATNCLTFARSSVVGVPGNNIPRRFRPRFVILELLGLKFRASKLKSTNTRLPSSASTCVVTRLPDALGETNVALSLLSNMQYQGSGHSTCPRN